MSGLVRFPILLFCCGLLAGCGGSDADQYQTFQPVTGSDGSATPIAGVQSQPVPAKAQAAQLPAAATGAVPAAAGAEPQPSDPAAGTADAGSSPAGAVAEPVSVGAEGGEPGPAAASATAANAGVSDGVSAGAQAGSAQSGVVGSADRPVIDNGVAGEVRQIQLLVPQKRFRRERPSEAVRVSYDDIDLLKVLNMEPVPPDAVQHFPEWLKSLDGKLVRIRGFMFPTYVATGLKEFALARDNGICCFVRQPKIYDIMTVQLAEGETTDYIANRPFDVEGIFRIDPDADQSELSRLYRIEQAKVLEK